MESPVQVAPMRASAKWQIFGFAGKRFYLRGGYYKADDGEYLHQAVWRGNFGPIPDGWHVHHRNTNKLDCSPDNLECLSPAEHGARHMEDADRRAVSSRHIRTAVSAAAEWRKRNPERSAEIAKLGAASLFERLAVRGRDTLACARCDKPYQGYAHLRQRGFCSASCQGMARKASGVDDTDSVCTICGAGFRTNRHSPRKTCSRACANQSISRARLQHRG